MIHKNLKIQTFDRISKNIRAKDWIRSYQAIASEYSCSEDMMTARLFSYLGK